MPLTIERIILSIVWLLCVVALCLVPRHKRREAQMSFLFMQFVSWILGLVVVEQGWLLYPDRELQKNMTSFTFEFFAYPTVAVYLNLYYPKEKSAALRFFYILLFPIGISVPEIFIEKYTKLIDYVTWKWYWTFLSVWVTLYLSHGFHWWYFKKGQRHRISGM
ncbi:CBO0543 family protein [Paenibacillus hexagrammi]|uniref:Histidine kinase N-terminal 7TM region domain-containing protein n=1 Tax=Paenibacillus hexagrammi TaxID=2908839 RepID=A0ABY3SHW1_9BACL|nr:CBO0543 family protein [Paenibacillus sp. YPD9-1]UJF32970.1 hypothetical protein L0M14_25895 [Paenibacillus sp. YPD9-1]